MQNRPIDLSVVLAGSFIINTFSLITVILLIINFVTTGSTGIVNLNGSIFLLYLIINVALSITSLYLMWKMKKMGFYLLCCSFVFSITALSLLRQRFTLVYEPIIVLLIAFRHLSRMS